MSRRPIENIILVIAFLVILGIYLQVRPEPNDRVRSRSPRTTRAPTPTTIPRSVRPVPRS